MYALTVQGTACLAGSAELGGVAFRDFAWPLPWTPATVSGLVETEHGPLVLLKALPTAEARAYDKAPLMAIIRSSKGLVAIEVEQVRESLGEQGGDASVKLMDHLAASLDLLSHEHSRELGAAANDKRTLQKSATFLRVSSAGVDVAVPADRVELLDQHQGAYPISPDQSREWLVKLGTDLVCAQSMSDLLGLHGPRGDETWCLCLDGPQQTGGLLVEQVKGLITVQASQIKVLSQLDGPSTWLMLEHEAPIRVLSGVQKPAPQACLDSRVFGADALAAEGQDTSSEKHRVLSLKVGPYQVAIAGDRVRAVIGSLGTTVLHKRRGSATCPVIDLGHLLAVPSVSRPDFAVTVQFGQMDVTLLCERAEFVPSTEKFWPLPAVPTQIHDVFQGVRLLKGRCELLLKSDGSALEWRSRVKKISRSSFVGWLPVAVNMDL